MQVTNKGFPSPECLHACFLTIYKQSSSGTDTKSQTPKTKGAINTTTHTIRLEKSSTHLNSGTNTRLSLITTSTLIITHSGAVALPEASGSLEGAAGVPSMRRLPTATAGVRDGSGVTRLADSAMDFSEFLLRSFLRGRHCSPVWRGGKVVQKYGFNEPIKNHLVLWYLLSP